MKKTVFTSKITCKTKDGKEVPKYKLVIFRQYDMYCYNEKKQEYHIVALYGEYILSHIEYLLDNDPERIQEQIDKGTLYRYLREVERKARKVVDSQVEKWKQNNEEIIKAHNSGDIQKEGALINGLKLMAEEIMYPCVIYA